MDLVIFIGLQGAGKSSFYRSRFTDTHALVSKDRLRNNRRPARRQRQLIEEALTAGRSLVVDNTNPTVQDRVELIELGRSRGATVIGYYFESRLEDCLERNRLRTSKDRVPDVALLTVANKPELPTYAEGFDRLYYVRLAGDQISDVQEWADAPTDNEVD